MDIRQRISHTFPAQVSDLQTLIRIPSVSRGEPKEGMPLGENVRRALDTTLDMARRMGFPTVYDLDGYCGIVEFGAGSEMLGIMAHLDVVPEGTGWTYPPYAAEIHDGAVYGRGAVDNKGAAISALYAMAAVKDSGTPMKRRVRLILGCDEEAGWKCMERYHQSEPDPDLAFTPDADYPVVNSEMGILHATYFRPGAFAVRMKAGIAANVIPGEASAVLPLPAREVAAPAGTSVSYEGSTITAVGRGGHAAMPELAENALTALIGVLGQQQELPAEDRALFTGLGALWARDRHGEHLGIDKEDVSGRLTYSPDMLTIDETGATFTCDCRYPFSVEHDALVSALDAAYGALGFARTSERNQPSHFIPADSELVTALMQVYNRNADKPEKPLSIGGGTYARSFKNAVAFGINPVGQDDLCHMPDENITLDQMRFNTVVMAEAIVELAADTGR